MAAIEIRRSFFSTSWQLHNHIFTFLVKNDLLRSLLPPRHAHPHPKPRIDHLNFLPEHLPQTPVQFLFVLLPPFHQIAYNPQILQLVTNAQHFIVHSTGRRRISFGIFAVLVLASRHAVLGLRVVFFYETVLLEMVDVGSQQNVHGF